MAANRERPGLFLTLHNPGKDYEGWYKAAVGVPLGEGNAILAAVTGRRRCGVRRQTSSAATRTKPNQSPVSAIETRKSLLRTPTSQTPARTVAATGGATRRRVASGRRQREGDARAAAGPVLGPDPAAVRLDQAASDREPEARAPS